MSARLAACCLLLLACGRRAWAACESLEAREGDVALRCEGGAPDWASLAADTSGVQVQGLRLPTLDSRFLGGVQLPRLTHLYLPHNQVESVLENATLGLEGLLTLDLSHNRLQRLEAGALAGSPRLRTLVLSHNHLLAPAAPLPQHWAFLRPLAQLQHLQLRHCSLSSVPEAAVGVLSSAAAPAELDVRGNPGAAPHCRLLLLRMRYDAGAPRLLCDAARATASRPPPAPLVVLWCVVAIASAAAVLGCLWRWRYGKAKGVTTTVPYRRFFLRGSEDA